MKISGTPAVRRIRATAVGVAAAFLTFEFMELVYSLITKGFGYPLHLWWHSEVWPMLNSLVQGHLSLDDIAPMHWVRMGIYAPFVAGACYMAVRLSLKALSKFDRRKCGID